jgi:hypothetical protein
MKKLVASILTISALTVGAVSAQNMLAGWDFSPYAFDNFSSTDEANLTGQVGANYRNSVADFTGGAAVGTLYYDGSFGSSVFDLSDQEISPQSIADTAVSNLGYLGTAGSLGVLGSQGQAFTNAKTLGFAINGSYTFGLTLGQSYDLDSFTYAGFNSGDASASVAWEWSTNGSSFTALETDSLGTSATAYSVDLSAIDGVSTVYIRGTLAGLDSGLSYIDNVAFNGTSVVPEPSSFAAIFGVVAIAFVAVRRRRS